MRPYRVLSLDGGGIRGVVTATILERLSRTPGLEGWLDRVDLIAGTSTGGLIALALADGHSPTEIRALYAQKGRSIFQDSWWDQVKDIGNLRGAQYGQRGLRNVLVDLFGTKTLAELRKKVLIPTFCLDNQADDISQRTWKPKLFHNFRGESEDGNLSVVKAALYTSAAPTYFPSVDGYIDGGVYANNPSMCALAQTQDARYRPRPRLNRVVLLSLGTGTNLRFIRGRRLDWGLVQWARPLLDILFDGMMGIADYQCRQILGERYHRLAPIFPPGKAVAMDEIRQLPYLVEFAESVSLDATVSWLRRHWQ